MRNLAAILFALFAVCWQPAMAVQPPSDTDGEPTASAVNDADFAYLMHHARLEAESDHIGGASDEHNVSYRIYGLTQQGSCVGGCPPSTIYVSSADYYGFRDGHVRLCRIEGLRFYSDVQVKEYTPAAAPGEVFLEFEVRSNPEVRRAMNYRVSVTHDSCSISLAYTDEAQPIIQADAYSAA